MTYLQIALKQTKYDEFKIVNLSCPRFLIGQGPMAKDKTCPYMKSLANTCERCWKQENTIMRG